MKRAFGSSQPTKDAPVAKKRKVVRKPRGTAEMYAPATAFPDVLSTKLRYNSTMARINPAAASYYASFILNGMFDFDVDNIVGNKQPLYMDTLLTADGPYKNYKVSSWTTKIEIHNYSALPLLCYWAQAATTGEMDSLLEVQNRSNVRELILTSLGGDKNHGIITAPGKVTDIYGARQNPADLSAVFSANPTTPCTGTIFLYNPGGIVATPVDCWIKVTHDFNVELNTTDMISS